MKGKAEPLVLWRATASRARFGADIIRRYETPFVGRELERALLIGTFERAAQQGSVQRVTVIGEPGVGKSRLIGELLSYVDAKPDATRWRQGRCLPYGEGIAGPRRDRQDRGGHPRIRLGGGRGGQAREDRLARRAGATVADRATRAAGRRRGPVARRAAGAVHGVAALPGGTRDHEPDGPRIRGPALADQSLLAFLEYLAEWSQGVTASSCARARRELYERRPGWGAGQRNAQTIDLSPLSEEETAELVSHLTRTAVLGPALGRAIVERRGQSAVRGGVRPLGRRPPAGTCGRTAGAHAAGQRARPHRGPTRHALAGPRRCCRTRR